jgi:hypothetical protein
LEEFKQIIAEMAKAADELPAKDDLPASSADEA